MKTVETIKEGKNFTVVNVGKLSGIKDYVLPLGNIEIPAPGQDSVFLHKHRNHEELYFILKGEGLYQVDGEQIPVSEGCVIRVAPEGKRALKNTGNSELLMLCVQYKGNTFTKEDAQDGTILNDELKW